jgi:hypothetical protein
MLSHLTEHSFIFENGDETEALKYKEMLWFFHHTCRLWNGQRRIYHICSMMLILNYIKLLVFYLLELLTLSVKVRKRGRFYQRPTYGSVSWRPIDKAI